MSKRSKNLFLGLLLTLLASSVGLLYVVVSSNSTNIPETASIAIDSSQPVEATETVQPEPTPVTDEKSKSAPKKNSTTTTAISYPEPQPCTKIIIERSPSLTLDQLTAQSEQYKEDIVNHYYDIYGSTSTHLKSQLSQCGPTEAGSGANFHAYTLTWVQYYYWYSYGSSSCTISRYVVHLTTDFFLPRWGNSTVSPQEDNLKTRTSNYIQSMASHEDGHRANAVTVAQNISSYINSFGSRPTCSELTSELESHASQLVNSIQTQDTQYDSETQHGYTQFIHPNIYD
ncbi:MAG: DUF922 domain-containing Zn-dependent protease [Candidatus Berkelbacteria bacterium]|nr:DUF922 domain-containing Zn-dependent protease [Candidatus Berkelbacteria bacterium]MCR4308322.1 DUF922 domain-containing Zn-dependent protease [Candidatus Berkelbacteria bacterium]